MATWTPEEIARLTQLLEHGHTYREAAHELGRTHFSVRGAAQRHGLMDPAKHNQQRKWSREEFDTLERLIGQRLTYQQIGERMGRTASSVRGATAHLGLQSIERRNASNRRDDWHLIDPIIRDCIEVEAMSGPQIVARLNALGYRVSRHSIHMRIRNAMPDLQQHLVANAARRRSKWRSIHARRRCLQGYRVGERKEA